MIKFRETGQKSSNNYKVFIRKIIRSFIFGALIIIVSNLVQGARFIELTDILIIFIVSFIMVTIGLHYGKNVE
jgi:hypothetical protein